jgi:arylsulfatase
VTKKPNVVFLLADNLGYGDVGCYGIGGELRGMPTPNMEQLAKEGVLLNQFMVEAACTPSRAACLTGKYSIRVGLSLVVVPGGPNVLAEDEYTLGDLFKSQNYDTIYFGKWHMGPTTKAEPQFHGFDEWRFGFHGSSDGTLSGDNLTRYHAPPVLQKAGTIMVREAKEPNKPSQELFPYDLDYRRKIDLEMTTDAVQYIHDKAEAKKPFFMFMGLTRPHFPNLPSEEFKGKSRIGNYGDSIMELDHNVGRINQAIKDAGIEENTILVFVSDNGPTTTATVPEEVNMGSPGPFRGELGDATEGSIRTVGMIKWPGQANAGGVAYGMVSIMDFLPTLASAIGADLPTDKPIDGIDQTDYLTGKQSSSNRENLLTFIGGRMAAVRWHQWRLYTFNTFMSEHNPSMGGYLGYMNETNGYPFAFNIEADVQERSNVIHLNSWLLTPFFQAVLPYKASLEKHPNPPVANLTVF